MYRLVLLPGLHKWARPGALENNPHHRGCPSDRWEPLSFQITGATADGRIRDPKVIKDLRVRETTARRNHQKECDALATHSKGAPPSHAACSKNWASSADRRGEFPTSLSPFFPFPTAAITAGSWVRSPNTGISPNTFNGLQGSPGTDFPRRARDGGYSARPNRAWRPWKGYTPVTADFANKLAKLATFRWFFVADRSFPNANRRAF